jgi:hypothetical protein
MFLKKIRSLTIPVILLTLLFISILVLANALIQMPSIQKALIDRVSYTIGYDIRTREIELDLWRGIGILIHDFDAKSRHDSNSFSASRVRIILDVRELISGRIVPSSLEMYRPKIDLAVKDELKLPAGSSGFGIKGLSYLWIQGIQSIFIEQGRVNFIGRSFHVEELYLDARQKTPSPLTLKVKSQGMVEFKGKRVPFDLNGLILRPSGSEGYPSVDIILNTGKAPLSLVTWSKSVPVRQGDFQTRLEIRGDLGGKISVNGRIDITSLKFSILKKDRHKDFLFQQVGFDFQSVIEGRRIRFQPLKIMTQDYSMDLIFLVDLKEKDNPYLELSAKSDFMTLEIFKNLFPFPLLAAWVEDELFPIFDNGDIKLNFFTLQGKLAQFKDLKIPENRSVLGLGLECRNLEASGKGVQVPFREVSCEITLKDGDFHVSGLGARFGNSLIKNAGLDIKGMLTHSPHFEILMDGSFDIQELMSQEEMMIIPPGIRRSLDQIHGLDGRMECVTRIGYERDWKYLRILKGEFFFTDCLFDKKKLLLPLKFKEAEIHINETNNNSFRSTGLWGNTNFNATGDFIITGDSFEIRGVDISADMDMNEAIHALSQRNEPHMKFSGPLPWHISMIKKDDYWSCLGNIALDGIALESEGFSIEPPSGNNSIVFDLDIKPYDRINIKEVLCRLNGSLIELSGEYNMQKKYPMQFNIRSSNLSIEDMGIGIKKHEIPTTGVLNGRLNISLSDRGLAYSDVTGQLEGKDLSFHLGILSSQISDCSFQLQFFGRQAAITKCFMNVGENPVNITGEIKGWNKLTGDIAIKSDFLDLSNILSPVVEDKEKDQDRFIRDMDIGIDLDISAGIWRKLMFKQMAAELNLRDGGLYIENCRTSLAHGLLTVNGHMITGKEPELLFTGDIRLTEQPIDELLEDLGIDDMDMKGSLTIEAQLTMTGKENKDLIPNLAGHAKVSLNQGLLRESRVIIKVLDFLSLQNIYKKRPPELTGEGFYFESMTADIIIDKGILESENFVMRSPVFNAVGYGKAEIPGRSFDFVLGAQPHETIDNLVNMIPILGYIIEGEKESVLLYSFKVKGPFSNPDVTFVPFESLSGGVGGILKRLLLSPIKILQDLNNAATKNQKDDSPGPDK